MLSTATPSGIPSTRTGKLTETMLLGNIAIRMQKSNTILQYDAVNMKISNLEEANQYLRADYRKGWVL